MTNSGNIMHDHDAGDQQGARIGAADACPNSCLLEKEGPAPLLKPMTTSCLSGTGLRPMFAELRMVEEKEMTRNRVKRMLIGKKSNKSN